MAFMKYICIETNTLQNTYSEINTHRHGESLGIPTRGFIVWPSNPVPAEIYRFTTFGNFV